MPCLPVVCRLVAWPEPLWSLRLTQETVASSGALGEEPVRVLSPAGREAAVTGLAARGPANARALGGDVVVLPGKGLRVPGQLPFERWLAVGRKLSDIHTSSAWCLGDWLLHGEHAYNGRYRDAVEQTSLDYQTLRNYAWVARRISLSRRRHSLSFGHHAEVAALPQAEQDFWLRKAEELSWPVRQLRREVRASIRERSAGEGSAQLDGRDAGQPPLAGSEERATANLTIQVTSWQLQSCQHAARRAGLSVEQWAALALARATRHHLGQDERPQQVASGVTLTGRT